MRWCDRFTLPGYDGLSVCNTTRRPCGVIRRRGGVSRNLGGVVLHEPEAFGQIPNEITTRVT